MRRLGYRLILCALICCLSGPAAALADIYFDFTAPLAWIAFLFLACVIFVVSMATGVKELATFSGAVFGIGCLLTMAFLGVVLYPKYRESEARKVNTEFESKWCRSFKSKSTVRERMVGLDAITVSIKVTRLAKDFPAVRDGQVREGGVSAAALAKELKEDSYFCMRSRVRILQDQDSKATFPVCSSGPFQSHWPKLHEQSDATFYLHIGEVWEVATYPDPLPWNNASIVRTSVRVARPDESSLRALDAVFLRSAWQSGAADCESLNFGVRNILVDAFPSPGN